MPDEQLELARKAYEQMAWADACTRYAALSERGNLDCDDLERAACAAQLAGRIADIDALWPRAIHEAERIGDLGRAARYAVGLGMDLMNRGEMAQAGGWFARADRMVAEHDADTVASGYVLIPVALQMLFGGDATNAQPLFVEEIAIGQRFGDADLTALGRLGLGNALLALGRRDEGLALLDDAMLSVTAGEVSPVISGIVYCAVIETCHASFDLRRAGEWTEALGRWCDAQPDLVAFRGQCRTHRAEIMMLHGQWAGALDEVQRACDVLLRPPPQPAVGNALYHKAELHSLRGEFVDAEEAFRAASEWGREPHPGLALLRLAQGRTDSAAAAIRRVIAETQEPLRRAPSLAACVEIMVAVDDVAAARPAAEELHAIAADLGAPALDATSAYSTGAVLLADGDAAAAIGELRRACAVWSELDMPRDAARARVLIGLACRELGDDDTASMELDIARRALEQLGAVTDLARLDALTAPRAAAGPSGLTGREVEVLELIAAGRTNRQIAESLFISERTVARHVSNIFTKLSVSTRSAATAYAFHHGLA
jgi:DNA-binding CsgD family transcriptional regulator